MSRTSTTDTLNTVTEAPVIIVDSEESHETNRRNVLVFTNPVFRSGLNITVRGGQDWFDNSETSDEIDIVSINGNYIGKGRVIWRQCFNWVDHKRQIEYLISKYNHDSEASYTSAQEDLLDASYGDRSEWFPVITIIGFELIK